jgi:IPT/TIG domain
MVADVAAQSGYVEAAECRPASDAAALLAGVWRRPWILRTWLAILLAAALGLAVSLAVRLDQPGPPGAVIHAAQRPLHSTQRLLHPAQRPPLHPAATLLQLPAAARPTISAALGRAEAAYRVSGLGAANPAQHMQLRFSASGVALSAGHVHLALSLRGVGRGRALRLLGSVAPRFAANRVSYVRDGLDEWYVNGPLGLEQGFDLNRRPAGSGVLTLAVAFSGASRARLRDGGALLSGPGGTLRYEGLAASDARGRPLHAWLGLSGGRLLIHVDDRGARYPIRIDPFIEQGEVLKGGGEVGEGAFGYSVALSADGNTALIGAANDDGGNGAAWVFTRAGGVWTQQGQKLTGGIESGPGELGAAVALSADGDTALLGAPREYSGTGAAWVYTQSAGVWVQPGEELASGLDSSHLGLSVALSADGNIAVLSGTESSGVREFERYGYAPGWARVYLVAEDTGGSVALSEDASTALLGGGATYGDIGTARVLVDLPEVGRLEPSTGPIAGGTQVTIDGRGFEGTTAVMFGSTPASFTVDSRTEITAVAPPAAAGEVEVSVVNAAGGSHSDGRFTYGIPPSAPIDVHASPGEGQATVSFEEPRGSEYESHFTVTASPGGTQETSSFDQVTMGGLKNGVSYTFTVVAANPFGVGPPSAPSNAVVPGQIVLGAAKLLASGLVELPVQVPVGGGVLSASQATATAALAHESTARGGSKKKSSSKKRSRHKPKSTGKSGGGAQLTLVETTKENVGAAREAVTLILQPTAAALRELAQRAKLAVPVQVSFVPEGGQSPSTATTDIGFVRPGYSFEAGTEGWEKAWGDLATAGSTAYHHTGKGSLQITIHSEPYAAVDATSTGSASQGRVALLQPGVPISMWVYRPASTPPVGFRAMVRVGNEWAECRSAEVRPRANRWVQLSITVPGSAHCKGPGEPHLEVHGVGVEIDDKRGVASGKSVYLDDVSW